MQLIPLQFGEVRVLPDLTSLYRAAADEFQRSGREAIREHGRFGVALAGGSTPKAMFTLLAEDYKVRRDPLSWDKVHVFWGDERHVPADHPDSNFRMTSEALLSHVPLPSANIHRIKTEMNPASAASEYEREIRSVLAQNPSATPKFDLILLGMGTDGHTASLFPGTTALNEQCALVVSNWVEKLKAHRVTFTYPLINAAAKVVFLAAGSDKAEVLRHVLRGEPSAPTFPAQGVQPESGHLIWMVDETAASKL